MWISSEDARSDFILAAAAVFLGVQLVSLIADIPGYPRSGLPFYALTLAWLLALSCGAPWALARYRNQVPQAFALAAEDRGRLGTGLAVVAPLLVGQVLAALFTGSPRAILTSLAGRFYAPGPTIGGFQWTPETIVGIVGTVILVVGCVLTGSFLAVRARDAFRSPDMDLTEVLRTFGLGAVGLSFLMGLLAVVRDGGSFLTLLTRTVALTAVILITDRQVPPRVAMPRASVIGPAIATLVLWVLAFGGPFRGDLVIGLTAGTSAAVVLIAAACLVHVRQGLAAALLLGASVVYPMWIYPMHVLPLLS